MDPERQLVVGLGNPGPRYRATRHNVGFLVVEELARRLGWTFRDGPGPWREAAAPDGRGPFTLLQPLTYMNRSGEAVLGWAAVRGFDPRPAPPAEPAAETAVAAAGGPSAAPPGSGASAEAEAPAPPGPETWRPLVICDDLALPLGALRLRARGSSGGQKGLASVIEALGHDDLPRLRLGIAPAGDPVPAADWPDYVLTPFAADEADAVADLMARAADAVACWAERGVEEAASRHNRR